MTKLGKLLAKERERKGWTLREAEAETGIHNAHLSQLEKGHIAKPNQPMLWTLADAYGLDYAELLRMAGHTTSASEAQSKRQLAGALLRGLEDLDEDDQVELLAQLEELRRNKRAQE